MTRVPRIALSSSAFAKRSWLAIAMVPILCASMVVATSSPLFADESNTNSDGQARAKNLFYTTSGAGTGLPNGAEIFAIEVSGSKTTTRDIGPTFGGDCCFTGAVTFGDAV
jgi:hypothetical protein